MLYIKYIDPVNFLLIEIFACIHYLSAILNYSSMSFIHNVTSKLGFVEL